jgi:hypothetical protein
MFLFRTLFNVEIAQIETRHSANDARQHYLRGRIYIRFGKMSFFFCRAIWDSFFIVVFLDYFVSLYVYAVGIVLF